MDAEASTSTSCGTFTGRGRSIFRTHGRPKMKRSASLFSCFPAKKPIKQVRQDDLLSRVRESSDRRCFTLPPMPTRTSTMTAATVRDFPDSFLQPARYPTLTVGERSPPPTHRPYHAKLLAFLRGKQAEANQSFLRAARAGNIGKITEYLNSNVDLNAVNSNGLNALHLASKEGHLAVVRLLLDHNAVIDAKTKKGNTSLHIASLAGRADIVRLLVERGADVNARSQNGFTPLYMAAQENHTDIVQFLLNKGANQALATDDGFTPLAVALQQGHDGIVALLLDRDAGSKGRLPALHIAAKKDDVHAATLLLANSEVNVNHTSAAGFTALHIAAHHGNVNVARLLISNGADVNFNAKVSTFEAFCFH
ncbi:hypothetical protein AAHC03_025990 [Spirometra sp. Aus1]